MLSREVDQNIAVPFSQKHLRSFLISYYKSHKPLSILFFEDDTDINTSSFIVIVTLHN
jgi:hypothetical protein